MNPNTKLKANLSIVNDKNLKIKIVEFFVKMFEGKVNRELSDITIKFKDENNQEDYVKLLNNLVHLKIQKEHYLDNISEIQNNENRRIEYSKSIYETLLGAYNEYNIQ